MNTNEEAVRALSEFDLDAAKESADEMAKAFEAAGDRISTALERAARTGEFSFSQMAESVARDLARLAVEELITAPLEGLINSVSSSLMGQATGSQKSSVNVTMNVEGVSNPTDFKKSNTQLAAGLTRAISQGRKLI